MKVDDRKLHTEREKNVFLQGQLAILDALISSVNKSVPWIFKVFTVELLTETRRKILDIYRGHFPESDVH